jgi:hypothetical protein
MQQAHGYGCYLHIQIALQSISDAVFDFECRRSDSSYALARSVSVLDAVNWMGLAVKKIKAETVKKSVLLKLGLGKVMWQIIWR